MYKKTICIFLTILLVVISLTGCGQTENREGLDSTVIPNSQTESIPSDADNAEETRPTTSEDSTANGNAPIVYMTSDISSDGLMAIYEALGASPTGNVAVKLSTGEPGSNYLRTDLIGAFVQSLDATIVECNTAYGGSRANTAMHYQVAEDHGYTAIANVDIMDEEGSMTLPVEGGSNLTENYVGSHFENYGAVRLSMSRLAKKE